MVGTAGFFGAPFASNGAEPATHGFLQTTTKAVVHYSPLLCQVELRPDVQSEFCMVLNKSIAA